MIKTGTHNLIVCGSSASNFPTELVYGVLTDKRHTILYEIEREFPFNKGWCKHGAIVIEEENSQWPERIEIAWLSIFEETYYRYSGEIPQCPLDFFSDKDSFIYLIIGMTEKGGIAIWAVNNVKSTLLLWDFGEKIDDCFANIITVSPGNNTHELCKYYKEKYNLVDSPSISMVKRMKQYHYGFLIKFKSENNDDKKELEPEIFQMKVFRSDASFQCYTNDEYVKQLLTGKPSKLSISWHIKKTEYTAYFWFEDEEICAIFDKFYGAHRDTKTDFIIHVDVEKNKYELALYRYGLKEPQVIAESAYQLIVFKNKFECYRSENYDQPKGAWVW